MKKWVIALAILFVASLISTICFGVSLGTRAVVALFKDDGIVETWANRIEAFMDDDIFDWDDVFDWDDDDYERELKMQSVELPAGTSLSVLVDCGNVRIVSDSGSTVRATLRQTTTHRSDKPLFDLTMEDDNNTLRVSTTQKNIRHGVKATLTVYVPSALAELYVETDVGNVELTDLRLDTLRVAVATGNLEMEHITAKQISAEVSLGEAEIGRDVIASESLIVDCSCGNIEFCLPALSPFSLDYKVQTGNAQIENAVSNSCTVSSARHGVGCEGSIWYMADSENVTTITLKVGTGNIEIETDD